MLEEKTIIVKGLPVKFLHGGKGKPVLFLHGWLLPSAHAYRQFLEGLAKKFEVFAPGMVARHVRSIDGYERFVKSFADSAGIKGFVVIGHSFGGAVAADFASRHPAYVKKLVLIDALGVPMKRGAFWWLDVIGKKVGGIGIPAFMRGLLFVMPFMFHVRSRRVIGITLAMIRADYRGFFKQVKCPTLVVWGEMDEVFPLEHAREISSLIKGSKVLVVKGTHDWPIFIPGLFSSSIMPFLIR